MTDKTIMDASEWPGKDKQILSLRSASIERPQLRGVFLRAAVFFAAKNRQPRRRRWQSCLFPGQDFIGFGQCHYSRFFHLCKKNRSPEFDKISNAQKQMIGHTPRHEGATEDATVMSLYSL